MKRSLLFIAGFLGIGLNLSFAQSAAVHYQGVLHRDGGVADGIYEMDFRLYTAAEGGSFRGSSRRTGVSVVGGLFETSFTIEAYPEPWDGRDFWLEMSVREEGGAWVLLRPRQSVTSVPYARWAARAQSLLNPEFLGTTALEPLDLFAGNTRALRLERNSSSNSTVNIIGGSVLNAAGDGTVGVTIAGGGGTVSGSRRAPNLGLEDFATVSGGYGNTNEGFGSTISGGTDNSVGSGSTISVIAGGAKNHIHASTVLAVIGGGMENEIGGHSWGSLVGGGENNVIGQYVNRAVIGGGIFNTLEDRSDYSGVGSGHGNRVGYLSSYAYIGGGLSNVIGSNSPSSVIVGGARNEIWWRSPHAFVGGGFWNRIETNSYYAVIVGGQSNLVARNSPFSFVGGGSENTIDINNGYCVLSGGRDHLIQSNADYSVISGGTMNKIAVDSWYATVSGGERNQIQTNADWATICGGQANSNLAKFATIVGGAQNLVSGDYGLAAGRRAISLHDGAFVWNDSGTTAVVSTNKDSVTFRAQGGYRLFTSTAEVGAYLAPGSGSWSSMSDRRAKENFQEVEPRAILEKVAQLPVATWNYRTQSEDKRHIGPTAQDFHAAFGVGDTDTSITAVDADGVALAAIQGLNSKLEEKDAEIRALKETVEDLVKRLDALSRQFESPPSPELYP